MEDTLNILDKGIIFFYFGLVLFIGVFTGLRRKTKGSEGFFLAGRSLNWVMIGAALFAANISTTHLVGLVANGFKDGMVWANFEWFAFPGLIILSLVFAPVYYRTKISTLPEFLERRYGPYTRTMLGVVALIFAIFAHIGISLYAGAKVFESFFGIAIWKSLLIISGATLIYTIIGGLKAVVITEGIQTIILVVGTIVMAILAVCELPEHGITTIAEFKNAVKPGQLSLMNGPKEANLPFISIVLGLPIIATYYFGGDQTIVQKVLGAKTLRDAQIGPIFTGFLKVLPVFMMVIPGIIAYILFKDIISDPDEALPVMIKEILPTGLKGVIAAALMAALMSTIAAGLNSSGTLVSMDIVKRLNPTIKDKTLLIIGKVTIFVVMVAAIFWSPLIGEFDTIFTAINVILAVLAPPVSCVMILGVFWKRGNQQAALVTMITGFVIGIIIFVLEFEPILGFDGVITKMGVPMMMQAVYLLLFSVVLFVVTALLTPAPPIEKTKDIAMDKPWDFLVKEKIKGIKDPRILSLILILVMAVLYFIFR